MREIKFRAWYTGGLLRNKKGDMFYDVQDSYATEDNPYSYFGEAIDNNDTVLMQYTGLKDKNGKEIYEGDIVKTKWCDDVKSEGYIEKVPDITSFHWFDELEDMVVEVIGNIYENADLLK